MPRIKPELHTSQRSLPLKCSSMCTSLQNLWIQVGRLYFLLVVKGITGTFGIIYKGKGSNFILLF